MYMPVETAFYLSNLSTAVGYHKWLSTLSDVFAEMNRFKQILHNQNNNN